MSERTPVLVRGVGDVGSAVAVLAYRAGYAVALHDDPHPATPRRGMAFADALFDGWATLDSLTGLRVTSPSQLRHALSLGDTLPVAAFAFSEVLAAMPWRALIDARMRKRAVPEDQRHLAPLTIGLGPNFAAGGNVDLAIETSWGDRLGAVIETGETLPLAGEPRPIEGVGRVRFVYAPDDGRFVSAARIGDRVEEGAAVASIGPLTLRAPISGVLRGLTRSGVDVAARAKVIEVDPRGNPASVFGVGERPRRIAEGVLTAMAHLRVAEIRMSDESIARNAPLAATRPRNHPAAFAGGAVIGALGGLIGLGGAEFRLPLLIGAFRFGALQAVILNKAMSLVVVASALPFRAAAVPFASVAAHWSIIVNLLAGSLVGAWVGASWATRIASQTLYRVIAILLLGIAVVLVIGHDLAASSVMLTGTAQVIAGVAAGFAIGIVAALMGVAGGELLIPTLILLFGVDIKLAGSLSLAVSLPTMLVGFARYSRDRSFVVLGENRRFVLVMAAGSILGSFIGGRLLGLVPNALLLPLLAVILVLSAFKVWKHK